MAENSERFVSLAEVKNMLQKAQKERKEMLYEQKIALEHAQKFAKLPLSKTKELIKELSKIEKLEKKHIYKIADLLPTHEDDVKIIFAKERVILNDEDIKNILEIVGKYYIE
jgi:DNA-directed RNA polymerase subunit F